jgi:NADH:ubiquinone oxidoreductase subunit 5 (subunit L)/multisubunit Na+/H+ antiporter MnhA subunit
VLRSLVPVAAAMLALTGALASACFVKVFGVAFLGQARSRHVRRARPVPMSMRVGQGMLAVLCLLLGVLPTTFIGLLGGVTRQVLGQALPQATAHGWLWLTPIAPATASYGAPLVALALFTGLGIGLWVFGRGNRRVRRCDAWDCGFAPPAADMQYTATAFAQPIRRVFGLLFHIEETVTPQENGPPRYRLNVRDRAWGLFYLPVARTVERAARQVVRLQSGNVRIYLGWSLATLVLLLWIMA